MANKLKIFFIPVQQAMLRCAIRECEAINGDGAELYQRLLRIKGVMELSQQDVKLIMEALNDRLLLLETLEKTNELNYYRNLASYIYANWFYHVKKDDSNCKSSSKEDRG